MELVIEIQKAISKEEPPKKMAKTDGGADIVDVKTQVNEIIEKAIEEIKALDKLPEAEKKEVLEKLEDAKI